MRKDNKLMPIMAWIRYWNHLIKIFRQLSLKCCNNQFSVQFSSVHSVVSDSLWPHESQHARPPCPSQTPVVYSNSCPSSRWCHPASGRSPGGARLPTPVFLGFPCGSAGKESACNVGDLGSILGLADPLEKGKAIHSSILACRIPWTV